MRDCRKEHYGFSGTTGDLVDLDSDKGQLLLKNSKEQGLSKFDKISPHFRKQTWKSFCGIQSVCTVLNALDCSPPGHTLYLEAQFWEYSISKEVEESVVRRQGMSLDQCSAILNSCPGITATHYRTDETTLTTFRQQLEHVMTTQNNQVRALVKTTGGTYADNTEQSSKNIS